MEYKINPSAYSSMFPVPVSLVDENIRLASVVQLKVILYFFRHSMTGEEVKTEDIAKALFLDEADVADALIFWRERGLLICSQDVLKPLTEEAVNGKIKTEPTKSEPQETKPQLHVVAELPISKPSHEQVAARLKECEQFRDLFSEAQLKLGKTIGYDGQSILIMLHDSYGLPFEVILMLLEYAKSLGKTSYSYIARLGKKWSELEIDSIEGAEQYITEQTGTDALWREFRELSGVKNSNLTVKQRRYFNVWRSEYGFGADMIYQAYERSIDRTEKMSLEYMDKVLKSWHDSKIKTPSDVEAEHDKWVKSKSAKSQKSESKPESAASYDLDAFAKKSVGLKYKKTNSK
ncbi:MAG: DnaD domain protein [Acutalibacteraceae bacterium]